MNTLAELSDVPVWLWLVLGVIWLAEVALAVYALVVLFRTPEERVVTGKRWIWLLLILLLSVVGPIVFLVAGRKPAQAADPIAQGAATVPTVDRAARAADVLYGPAEGGQAGMPESQIREGQGHEGAPQ